MITLKTGIVKTMHRMQRKNFRRQKTNVNIPLDFRFSVPDLIHLSAYVTALK